MGAGGVENNGRTTARRPEGVTGRGFVSGQSGNPGGRPRGIAALVREQTADGAELVGFMLDVLRGQRGRKRAPLAARLQACAWLADRAFGKPVQQVDASMALDIDATVSGGGACAAAQAAREAIRANLTDEDLDRMARTLLDPE